MQVRYLTVVRFSSLPLSLVCKSLVFDLSDTQSRHHTSSSPSNAAMNNNQGNRGGEDYLDKALDKVEQMAGKKVRTKYL